MIYNTCKKIKGIEDLYNYLSSDLINELYFKPKKINKDIINNKLNDSKYIEKLGNTINTYKNLDMVDIITRKINEFELDTSIKLDNYKVNPDSNTDFSFTKRNEMNSKIHLILLVLNNFKNLHPNY